MPHEQYLQLIPDEVVDMAGGPIAIIDCYGILSDDAIRRYFDLGCEVKGLGRGHIQRIKDEARAAAKATNPDPAVSSKSAETPVAESAACR